jgi:hypothetical protein
MLLATIKQSDDKLSWPGEGEIAGVMKYFTTGITHAD